MTRSIARTLMAALGGDDSPGHSLAPAREFGIDGYLARVLGVEADGVEERRVYTGLQAAIQRDAAIEVGAAFRAAGVPHFFYKGIALLGSLYELGDRELQDIDVHVARAAREAALAVLADLGYRPAPDDEQPGPPDLRSACVLHREAVDADVEIVTVDLHWAVEPLDRLLPRATVAVPDAVWDALAGDALTVPSDECHLVFLAHHVAHHDMLHLKGLLDFVLLWQRLPAGSDATVEAVARAMGAWRAVQLLGDIVTREFGVPNPGEVSTVWDWRANQLGASDLTGLVRLALARPLEEAVTITPARIRRRWGVIDHGSGFWKLLADVVAPPRAHLMWRWPGAGSPWRAWGRHASNVAGKLRGK
jgi:hypothetical protein